MSRSGSNMSICETFVCLKYGARIARFDTIGSEMPRHEMYWTLGSKCSGANVKYAKMQNAICGLSLPANQITLSCNMLT